MPWLWKLKTAIPKKVEVNFLRFMTKQYSNLEDERPSKMTTRPEEELPGEKNKHDDEGIDDSTDMDGDSSPD